MRLTENTAERPYWNFVFLGNDHGVDIRAESSHELHVAALLAEFDETGQFEPALDLAEW